jgi:anaerobic C4-dicarboxylate transporter
MHISLDSLGHNPLHSDNIFKGFITSCVITVGAAKISDYIVSALLGFIKLVIREMITSNRNFFEKK